MWNVHIINRYLTVDFLTKNIVFVCSHKYGEQQ